MYRLAVAFAAIFTALAGSASVAQNPRTDTQLVRSQTRASAEADLDTGKARNWGLDAEEWTRYRQLMQGPLGVHSPNLDPLTALGIEARSDDERRHYAELQVRIEARRVEKLLAYQRAYDDAWRRLYPGQPRVTLPEASAASSPALTGSGRLAVFVKEDCAACTERVKALQQAGATFDLYMVGSRQDDARIRRWATQAGIDPSKVQRRTITLNHDGGRWLSLGLAGELPAVVREVNGQWQRLP
ncbi:integrating conjugative element protein [Pseudomonas sp. PIC25]|uniref:TIGR03759 family integrating conjugative element protein n=1 Tax=Pseudomonas sp. PIC25 TaxID=1958773 RepID=UPI000BAB9E7C|nr:TIGR03759 family integrating conjugative element protein [Pseudomonas sp. PIC25]PAU51973.1 integrating conjugative element protein [Pseudomonas sp. PIC25]